MSVLLTVSRFSLSRPVLSVALGLVCLVGTASAQELPPPTLEPAPESRVVAYIYGDTPITRADLGEFLIDRFGAEKLQLLVNKKIIERACRERKVTVTSDEIQAALQEDLTDLGVNKRDFVNVVLKNYGKSLYEWENDVIKPRLLLSKLVRGQIEVSEDDLKKMFEHLYGEKVRARIIMWPPGSEKAATRAYGDIRASEEAFSRAAREQPNSTLAAAGGQIAPIAKHSFGESNILEKEAFLLQKGELSRLLTTPEGLMVIKCDGRIPPDSTKSFEKERDALKAEFINRRLQMEIPKLFARLQKEANPKLFLGTSQVQPAGLLQD